MDELAQSHGAGVRTLDFLESPEESRTIINDWVSDQTEERIKDLIPEGAIDGSTVMVLTNAIYFNAAWLHPFAVGNTRDRQFNPIDGGAVDVPMMNQTEKLGYASGAGYQAVELPYDGDELLMIILMPDEGHSRKFEEALDAGIVGDVTNDIEFRQVSLTMPKFEFESSFRLADILKAMGMTDAFEPRNANLSGMGISDFPAIHVGSTGGCYLPHAKDAPPF